MSYTLDESSRDFDRIADALEFLGENWQSHPDLDAAARSAGLSPHHFQRVFTRWVGMSPKKYVGALAHQAARSALDDGANLLDAAFDAGLSGPGRLHDLFIAHEAVTPGDAKRRGAGLSFVWGVAPSPFGDAVFLISPRGLSALAFADPDVEAGFEDLRSRYPAADYARDDDLARQWAERIFTPSRDILCSGLPEMSSGSSLTSLILCIYFPTSFLVDDGVHGLAQLPQLLGSGFICSCVYVKLNTLSYTQSGP